MGFFEWLHRLFVPSHRNAYRPHLLRRRSLLLFLGLMLLAEAALVANILVRQSGHSFLAAVIQSEILSLTNDERARQNVGSLSQDSLLDRSAQAKAEDMAAKGYFSHESPDGTTPWAWIDETGYEYQYAGENLAVRFVDSKDVVTAWMASPTHKANLLKASYSEIGIGIAQGMYQGQPATFVVQHFAKPRQVSAAAPTPPAPLATASPSTSVVAVLGAEAESEPIAVKEVPPAVPVEAEVSAPVAAPTSTFDDSLARQLGRVLSEPRAATGWALGGMAALLMAALAFAFVHHMQIQAHDLLLPGAVVAGIALMLIAINGNFLFANLAGSQPAGVAMYGSGVVVTPDAASD